MLLSMADDAVNIDRMIAYHEEMELLANTSGDFTKAEHHKKMQEIFRAMKEKLHPMP